MPPNKVEITYEAFVRGIEQVRDLSAKTAELQRQNAKLTQTVQRVTADTNKSVSANLQARRSILDLRKEIFAAGVVIGSAVMIMKDLARNSDALGAKFELLGDKSRDFKSDLGDAIAGLLTMRGAINALKNLPLAGFLSFGSKGAQQGASSAASAGMSRESRIALLGLQAESASLRGDSFTALLKRQESERIKLLEAASKSRRRIIEDELLERQRLEREAFRMAELSLKHYSDIFTEFKRGNVQIFKGTISEGITAGLTGKLKSREDIMGFVSSIGNQLIKNAADMIAESIATKVFAGEGGFGAMLGKLFGVNTTEKATEKARQAEILRASQSQERILRDNIYAVLQGIQQCVCASASYLSAMGGRGGTMTATISGGGAGALGKIGAIAGLVGAVAGGAGGFKLPSGGGLPAGAGIQGNSPFGGFTNSNFHAGGWVRSFSTGGEVPAMVQPGEFVMRKSVAQDNRSLLEGMNRGDMKNAKGGGGNVFLIRANDASSFSDMLTSPSAKSQLEIQVMKAIMTNGQIRKVIRDFAR